jgi:serine protease AprX
MALGSDGSPVVGSAGATASAAETGSTSPLAELAASKPDKHVEVIVQMNAGVDRARADTLAASAGGVVERPLPIINGFSTTLRAAKAQRLAENPAVHAISLNAPVETQTLSAANLATSYNQSILSPQTWAAGKTGKGVGVAVIDTGIQGNLPDFKVSQSSTTSRVVATAVTNPAATTASDTFGHGTHIAGLIAGNGWYRSKTDPLLGKYMGVAPDANLISIKASDDLGNASVLDVIDGLQFAIDKKSTYNIRVVNLSLKSSEPESYKTDPLDAAVEAAWNSGIVVVAAAGNEGQHEEGVDFAPANDPYVITVGAVDDGGTAAITDDFLTSWSSHGRTQDGFAKPDVVAPGAHLASTIPLGSAFSKMCDTCLTDGEYFKMGGTSMAAAVVSGEAALLISANSKLTPDQVKSQIVRHTRPIYRSQSSTVLVDASGNPVPPAVDTSTDIVGAEITADKALSTIVAGTSLNAGLIRNSLLIPTTGLIDYTRASWSRASWSSSITALRASWSSKTSWSRASWSRASWSATPEACSDFERASWSRASWSRASWSRASWSTAIWSADGMSTADISAADLALIDAQIASAKASCSSLLTSIDPTRASWSTVTPQANWASSFDQ